MDPKTKQLFDTFLEVSTSADSFVKLVRTFFYTIQPPFPDFPPESSVLQFYREKTDLPVEKQSLVDEFLKKYKAKEI
jgi:hypothetical protein